MTDDERSKTADEDVSENDKLSVMTIRVKPEMAAEIAASSKLTGLKQSDVMRLALERGLPVVVAQLNPEA
jgi:hypothetical protein